MHPTLGIVWTETLISVWFLYWIVFGWFKWAENLKQSGVVWIMSTTGLDWFGLDTDDLVSNRFNLWTEFSFSTK